MKTTAEKIAVMQAAKDARFATVQMIRQDEEGDYVGDWRNVEGEPLWDWCRYDYRIKPPEPIAKGNNPDNLTVSQVGKGWRLLTKEEIEERAKVMKLTKDIDCWQCDKKWYYGREDYDYDDDRGFYGHLTGCTFRTQKPEGYFLSKEHTATMWAHLLHVNPNHEAPVRRTTIKVLDNKSESDCEWANCKVLAVKLITLTITEGEGLEVSNG